MNEPRPARNGLNELDAVRAAANGHACARALLVKN